MCGYSLIFFKYITLKRGPEAILAAATEISAIPEPDPIYIRQLRRQLLELADEKDQFERVKNQRVLQRCLFIF